MKKTMNILLIMAAMLMIFSACKKDEDDGDNNTNNPTGNASLDVTLKAAYSTKSTATYDAVNLDIQQISFHTSEDTTVAGGWYDLETIPGIYNLMDFVSNDTLVAFDSLVSPQTISQIRLLLGENNTVVEDGETYDLSTPSGQTSGIKILVHTQMVPDSTYVIMLDFDPEESVHKTGNDTYKLRPKINAVVNP